VLEERHGCWKAGIRHVRSDVTLLLLLLSLLFVYCIAFEDIHHSAWRSKIGIGIGMAVSFGRDGCCSRCYICPAYLDIFLIVANYKQQQGNG
jgi:hypothetical protein